jgi:transposase
MRAANVSKHSPTLTEVWRITGDIQPDDAQLNAAREAAGKYLIATNELDLDRVPTAELLTVYKDQNRSVERGFRFLKDPLFFASSFFLKKPARIMALLMVMGLSLLVYARAEHVVRSPLVERDEAIADQPGYPPQRPTMRRIFQLFEGIDVLHFPDGLPVTILNLKAIHRQILLLFSPTVQKFYFSDG